MVIEEYEVLSVTDVWQHQTCCMLRNQPLNLHCCGRLWWPPVHLGLLLGQGQMRKQVQVVVRWWRGLSRAGGTQQLQAGAGAPCGPRAPACAP